MRYFNAVQAARELDISDKTIRRYIEKGKLAATRKESGELAISEEEIEKLRLERDLERSYQKYRQSLDIPMDTALDMARQIEKLTTRVSELEARLVHLESRHISSDVTVEQNKAFPYRDHTIDVQPQQSPLPSFSSPNRGDIPEGSLLFSDFAARHQVKRATMWRHCTSGIQGGTVKTIEKPKPGGRSGDKERWLTLQQQGAAIEFWRRHNVRFSLCEDEFCDCHG